MVLNSFENLFLNEAEQYIEVIILIEIIIFLCMPMKIYIHQNNF